MSMIDRYKKHGGFNQLLNLIETSGSAKQEKFLAIIKEEAPEWEMALRKKMLTIQKIFAWNDATLAEIVTRLQPITLAAAFKGLPEDTVQRILVPLGPSFRRKIDEYKDTAGVNPAEITAAYVKIINEVREMVSQGVLKFEKFAPELAIEQNIEEKLASGEFGARATDHASEAPKSPGADLEFHLDTPKPAASAINASASSANGSGHHHEEIESLKKQVLHLHKENEILKKENRVLVDKLAQIRKIA